MKRFFSLLGLGSLLVSQAVAQAPTEGSIAGVTANGAASSCTNFSVEVDTIMTGGGCNNTVTYNLQGTFPMSLVVYWGGGAGSGPVNTINSSPTTLTNFCPESYFTVITDGSGCTDTLYFIIGDTVDCSNFSAQLTSTTDVNGVGTCDGTSVITMSGGTANYTINYYKDGIFAYSLLEPTNMAIYNASCAGNWTAYVTDSDGCEDIVTYSIGTDTCGNFNVGINPINTLSGCNTAIDYNLQGTFPMTLVVYWAGGASHGLTHTANASPFTLNGFCPESYFTVVTDANGCSDTIYFVVNTIACAGFSGQVLSTTNESSAGACDGTAVVALSGGAAPYSFTYYLDGVYMGASTEQTDTITLTGACAGSWTVNVYDASNCMAVGTATIGSGVVGTAPIAAPNVVNIAPNPANTHIQLTSQVDCMYMLYDLSGRPLRQSAAASSQAMIEVGDLAQGVYVLQVWSGKEVSRHKVVISR